MTLDEALTHPTLPIPVAGAVFYDLGRNASYEAAKRGELPVISFGRKKKAVVSQIALHLGLKTKFGEAA